MLVANICTGQGAGIPPLEEVSRATPTVGAGLAAGVQVRETGKETPIGETVGIIRTDPTVDLAEDLAVAPAEEMCG